MIVTPPPPGHNNIQTGSERGSPHEQYNLPSPLSSGQVSPMPKSPFGPKPIVARKIMRRCSTDTSIRVTPSMVKERRRSSFLGDDLIHQNRGNRTLLSPSKKQYNRSPGGLRRTISPAGSIGGSRRGSAAPRHGSITVGDPKSFMEQVRAAARATKVSTSTGKHKHTQRGRVPFCSVPVFWLHVSFLFHVCVIISIAGVVCVSASVGSRVTAHFVLR